MRVRIAVCALTLSALFALSACSLLPSASKPAQQPAATTVVSKDPHVPGADCKKCHVVEHKRWAESLHASSAQDVLANVEHDKAELLTDECITCHAPFQVSTFKIGQLVTPLDQKGPWKINTANAAKWQAIKCEVCHDPTSSVPFKLAFYDGAKRAYVPVTDATDLCSKCHVPGTDDSRDLKGSVHEGLKCTACHFGSGMKADPKLSCVNCHPAVNKKHPDVTQLDGEARTDTVRASPPTPRTRGGRGFPHCVYKLAAAPPTAALASAIEHTRSMREAIQYRDAETSIGATSVSPTSDQTPISQPLTTPHATTAAAPATREIATNRS